MYTHELITLVLLAAPFLLITFLIVSSLRRGLLKMPKLLRYLKVQAIVIFIFCLILLYGTVSSAYLAYTREKPLLYYIAFVGAYVLYHYIKIFKRVTTPKGAGVSK